MDDKNILVRWVG